MSAPDPAAPAPRSAGSRPPSRRGAGVPRPRETAREETFVRLLCRAAEAADGGVPPRRWLERLLNGQQWGTREQACTCMADLLPWTPAWLAVAATGLWSGPTLRWRAAMWPEDSQLAFLRFVRHGDDLGTGARPPALQDVFPAVAVLATSAPGAEVQRAAIEALGATCEAVMESRLETAMLDTLRAIPATAWDPDLVLPFLMASSVAVRDLAVGWVHQVSRPGGRPTTPGVTPTR